MDESQSEGESHSQPNLIGIHKESKSQQILELIKMQVVIAKQNENLEFTKKSSFRL